MIRRAFAPLVFALAGCASVPPAGTAWGTIAIDGVEHGAEWTRPAGTPAALLVLEHGYARRCANLRGTARRIADAGLLVLCIDADMARGNPALASALARALLADAALPRRIAVGGHSAGGLFAVRLGAALADLAPERLAGALLLDPVAGDGFAADLQAIVAGGARPVLAVMAPAAPCNADGNAAPALRATAGVRIEPGASHGDAEGDDTGWLLVAACGRPQQTATEALREWAAGWAADVAASTPTSASRPPRQ